MKLSPKMIKALKEMKKNGRTFGHLSTCEALKERGLAKTTGGRSHRGGWDFSEYEMELTADGLKFLENNII